jgi:hypothetical protein
LGAQPPVDEGLAGTACHSSPLSRAGRAVDRSDALSVKFQCCSKRRVATVLFLPAVNGSAILLSDIVQAIQVYMSIARN